MFENPEIALEDLPRAADVDWQPIDRRLIRVLQLQTLMGLAIAAVPMLIVTLAVAMPPGPPLAMWSIWTLVLVATLSWPPIAVPRRGYVLRDNDMLFRKGVLWRSVTAVPFNRIQHVETSSNPLDRKFGLATLQLFTAGGSGGDLKVDGLDAATAEQLRLFILGKAGSSIEHAD